MPAFMCALVYLFSVLMILAASVSPVPFFAATEEKMKR